MGKKPYLSDEPIKVCWLLKDEFENLLKEIVDLYGEITEETVAKWFKDFCDEFGVEGFVITGDGKHKILLSAKQLFDYIVKMWEVNYGLEGYKNLC